jgi:hypothetical protein
MRTPRVTPVLAPLALLALAGLLAGCQSPDVGQRCRLPSRGTPVQGPTPDTAAGDFLEFGNVGCDNLVCIVSPAVSGSPYNACPNGECGYCSKPCVSDADCFRSETGLACRQMVLDPAFMTQLAETDPELLSKYLADIQFSSYCAVPR